MQKLIEIFPLIETDPDLAAAYTVMFIIAVTVVIFIIHSRSIRKKDMKRVEGLRRHAEERGLRFTEEAKITGAAAKGLFFIKGNYDSRHASNMTLGVKAGRHDFNVFDYEYITGSNSNTRQYHRYACALCELRRTSGRVYPFFYIEPDSLLYRIENLFNRSDIYFSAYPRFSKIYHVTGPSKERIEAFFTPAVISCLESHPGLEIYYEGNYITICRKGLLKPPEMEDFEAEAAEIIQALAM
ncbi:MAG: hypothetical protein K5838_08820 [Elusimicrobiales bacterium]|nr:hypothetical protein [Elusimicrobiales bacterium]